MTHSIPSVVELTRQLIRFKSLNTRPDEIHRCADFIESFLASEQIVCQRFEHDGVPSILVTPEPAFAPVLLMSHIDVVDGPDNLFVPVEKDGKLFGRGSIDDKYAVALSLVLLVTRIAALRQTGRGQQDLPFGVLITGDEEIGGANGAKKVLARIKTDFCIALDGGSVADIVTLEKGILRIKLTARGRTAHAARPWLGENAIENLIADYRKIKPFFTKSTADHWHRTLNFSCIQAGTSDNQVPDRAEALFDIRYTDRDDPDELVAAMRREVAGELTVLTKAPVFDGGQSPYLDLLLSIAPDTNVGFEHGASDARHVSEMGIPAIVWGADGDLSGHSETEHLNIASVYKLYELLDAFLTEAASIPPHTPH